VYVVGRAVQCSCKKDNEHRRGREAKEEEVEELLDREDAVEA